MTRTLILCAPFRLGRRLIHPGRYRVPSVAMDERTAREAIRRGLGAYDSPPQPAPVPVPAAVVEETPAAVPKKRYRRRQKGPAPENKGLPSADDTRDALD